MLAYFISNNRQNLHIWGNIVNQYSYHYISMNLAHDSDYLLIEQNKCVIWSMLWCYNSKHEFFRYYCLSIAIEN